MKFTRHFSVLFLLLAFFVSPKMVFAGAFTTETTDFDVTLTSPLNNGQSLTNISVTGTYNSSRVNPAYSTICMIPFYDANTWNESGVNHLVAQISLNFTTQTFSFNPSWVCFPRPASNTGTFGVGFTLPLGQHRVGVLAMGLTGSGPSFPLSTGYYENFAPVTLNVVSTIVLSPPTATISLPSADQSVVAGSSISFEGTGTSDQSGGFNFVSDYEWDDGACSSSNAVGTGSFYTNSTLSIGLHTIYLRVKDYKGNWSTNCPPVGITVTTPPAPTVTLGSYSTSVTTGGSATLYWSGLNATSCSASSSSGDWSGSVAYTYTTQTLTFASPGTYTYNLSCSGLGGTTSATPLTITVTNPPPPSVYLYVSPTSVLTYLSSMSATPNSTAYLSWYSFNATSCTGTDNWSGAKSLGMLSDYPYLWQEQVGPLSSGTKTYTLSCTGAGGTTNTSATITVSQPIDGTCGTADGRAYAYGSASYSPYAQCGNGSPSSTTFPSADSSAAWTCSGTDGGATSAQCSASQNAPPTPTSSVSIDPDPTPYGATPGVTLSSTNGDYCYVDVDWAALPGTPGYFTSGTFYPASQLTPGAHQAESFCYSSALIPQASWSTTDFTVSAPPTASVSISENPMPYGNNPGFTLSSTNGYYCYVRVGTTVNDMVDIPGSPGYFTSGTFYHGAFTDIGAHTAGAYCYNSAWAGSGWYTTGFTVSPPPLSLTFSASPTVLTGSGAGESQWVGATTLTWNSTNAASCTGTNFSTGGATSSSISQPISFTTRYDLTCPGITGSVPSSVSSSAIVTVNYPAATAALTASPKTVKQNATTQLRWTIANVKVNTYRITQKNTSWSQSIANPQTGTGTVTSPAITGQTTFTLTCTGLDASTPSVNTSVTVSLIPRVREL